MKIVVLGAGPTSIGAAHRLAELGHPYFTLYEKNDYIGGHSASTVDAAGFVWDEGGHCVFSKYDYYNALYDKTMADNMHLVERRAWVWQFDRFIPYPYQNNIRYLPPQEQQECVMGILDTMDPAAAARQPKNFHEHNVRTMGAGITQHFMDPYNFKVWAWPSEEMSYTWIGERVSKIDARRALSNIILGKDDANWGPNNSFKYALRGGTGEFYKRVAEKFADKIGFKKKVVGLKTAEKKIVFEDGTSDSYDKLVSAMPVDVLVAQSDLPAEVKTAAANLKFNSGFVFGIGGKGELPEIFRDKTWIYYPEEKYLFQRINVHSNYSKEVAPPGHWAILFEISYSEKRPLAKDAVRENIMEYLKEQKIISVPGDLVTEWSMDIKYFYPVPTLDRDANLKIVQAALMKAGIYSRGRYGAWKYEISNMDHCFMQGVEAVDNILNGKEESVWQM